MMIEATSDIEELKARLRATWMSGDYGHFATYLEAGALDFLARLNIAPGTRMLDVACGAGQIAIPAARAGVRVTGVDIAANLIEQARARGPPVGVDASFVEGVRAEGVDASFDEGDAESLAYHDAQFDLVVSLIGAMFAPRANRVAAELLRVCRPGGRIVMANWTAGGHVGQMFGIIGKYVPPSPLMDSPLQWGDEGIVRERLGAGATRLIATKRLYPMHYPFSPAEVVDLFVGSYGPMVRAMAALDAEGQASLRRDLVDLWTAHNTARDGRSTHVDAEFLEVVVDRA
jgi:SAM-dependent methyltransferase